MEKTEQTNNLRAAISLSSVEASLRTKIKLYLRRAKEIQAYLTHRPDEWGRFQSEFNSEVNNVFRDIMEFEKTNFNAGQKEKVKKLKKIFVNRIRGIFLKGAYNQWSLSKPFGYAGDFKIIDDIYQNNPSSTGFERLFDNYFQMSAISVAVRNRKEDFKRIITTFINTKRNQDIRIMNLACGPNREIKEVLSSDTLLNKNVVFDCYDHEPKAIEYAKTLLDGTPNINFSIQNALRISVSKNVNSLITQKYDLIYSTGLFDYLNYRISVRLAHNLKKLLKSGGLLIISDVRDKYSNPSVHYMEWVGEWNLIYRNDDDFRKIFIEAGFKNGELKSLYEQQGIMQYIIASNKKDSGLFREL